MEYLPILMGFRYCYKRYMAGFQVTVRSNAKGATIVEGAEGNVVDKALFFSISTYFYFWKRNFPQLKISRPVEDICPYCFAFTNRHRFLVDHAA